MCSPTRATVCATIPGLAGQIMHRLAIGSINELVCRRRSGANFWWRQRSTSDLPRARRFGPIGVSPQTAQTKERFDEHDERLLTRDGDADGGNSLDDACRCVLGRQWVSDLGATPNTVRPAQCERLTVGIATGVTNAVCESTHITVCAVPPVHPRAGLPSNCYSRQFLLRLW
jgi:hypothetical protein